MARRKSKGPPKVQQMGYSGVAKKDLAKLKKQIKDSGGEIVNEELDHDTMAEFPDEGEFWIVDYKR